MVHSVWLNHISCDFESLESLPVKYICAAALVNKDLRHHEIGDNNRDGHRVVLIDRIDAFEIFVGERCERKAP